MDEIKKPWGCEELIEVNEKYMLKRLTMLKGSRCSLQYHEYKIETVYVLSGSLKITFGHDITSLDSKILISGDSFTIPSGLIHRMEGLSTSIYLEASTPELDDVIRLQDDFNRLGK